MSLCVFVLSTRPNERFARAKSPLPSSFAREDAFPRFDVFAGIAFAEKHPAAVKCEAFKLTASFHNPDGAVRYSFVGLSLLSNEVFILVIHDPPARCSVSADPYVCVLRFTCRV